MCGLSVDEDKCYSGSRSGCKISERPSLPLIPPSPISPLPPLPLPFHSHQALVASSTEQCEQLLGSFMRHLAALSADGAVLRQSLERDRALITQV